MSFFDDLILNIIFILFPILIYYIFFNNKKNIYKEIIHVIISLISILFILKYTNDFSIYTRYIMINTLLIFSIANNKKISFLIISIILIYLMGKTFNYSYFWLSLEYILYFIFFELKGNIKEEKYRKTLNYFILIKGSILTMEIIYLNPIKQYDFNLLLEIFILLLVFYLIALVIFKIIEKCYLIINLSNELLKLNKEKEIKQGLFKITHEVKNPLAVCKGYLSMMNYNDIEKVKKYNNIIKKEINRTLDIMNNFSDYTKINIEKKILNLNELIYDVKQSIETLIGNKKIKIIYENKDNILINGDYERLKQVFINIIKNSIESIEEEGIIKLILKDTLKEAKIEIIDNGCGMDEETMHKIQEMFYTTKKEGTGIGIPLCKEIIEQHNGKIKYLSEENVGTKVKINLPKNLQ